ncbi:MAG: SMP-30/gluconolactonase/LRE family protein [Chloroflexi bacterium]|nr:SMP-30/gluconolactonase/LRE family protein [Chloroflexota bacterium]
MPRSLADILEPGGPVRVATGFTFTEGPLWHPDGYLLFTDVRESKLFSIRPGDSKATLVRENTGGGNGLTLDKAGRLIICEGTNRRVTRAEPGGRITVLADRYLGKRLNRPNDVVCRSDGTIYFTNPGMRVPREERELSTDGVYRIFPDGGIDEVAADFEYPNGLAFSPDERRLYVANTRPHPHLRVYEAKSDGSLQGGKIFAEMPYTAEGETGGVPDGLKIDVEGRIYCTGPGGVWVWAPDGTQIGLIRLPELPANVAFGGPDRRTLFCCARTSVYSVRTRTPGVSARR